jgi:hypothetical protein
MLSVFSIEFLIAHREIYDALDEPDYGGNECPAKYQIQNSLADSSKIKFMDTKASKKQSKNRGCHSIPSTR